MEKGTVYVIQDIPGTREGRPKINIIGASEFGSLKVLLPENAQIILSSGPVVFKLRQLLKDYTPKDYLLLTGDPAIIGVACSVVSDITNGKYNLLILSSALAISSSKSFNFKTLSDKVFAASICVTDSTRSCSKFIVMFLSF